MREKKKQEGVFLMLQYTITTYQKRKRFHCSVGIMSIRATFEIQHTHH